MAIWKRLINESQRHQDVRNKWGQLQRRLLGRVLSKTCKTKLLAFLRPPSRSIRSSIALGGRFKSFASCRISADFRGTVSAFLVMNLLWLCLCCHDLLALVSTNLWQKVATPFPISCPSAIVTSSRRPMALLGHLHLCVPQLQHCRNVVVRRTYPPTQTLRNHAELTSQQGLSLGNMTRWNALDARNILQVPMSFHDISCHFWGASSTIIPGPERWSSSTGSFTLVCQ